MVYTSSQGICVSGDKVLRYDFASVLNTSFYQNQASYTFNPSKIKNRKRAESLHFEITLVLLID